MFGLVCAGQTLLTAWLIERWFGRAFKLEDVSQVLGFLVASAVGAATGAVGAAIAVNLVDPTTSPLHVWRLWFAAGLLGTVTVAPLLIGIGAAFRQPLLRSELIEGLLGFVTLAALCIFLISLPHEPWDSALPVVLVFPVLLWITVRCRPVFAAAAAFVVALAIVWSTISNVGHFGDPNIPLEARVLAAQTHVLAGALLALVLAALFADRRRSEEALSQGHKRLQLALDGAELGAFSLDLATGRLDCDVRSALMHGHNVPPLTIKEGRRFVHKDDLVRLDAAFEEVMSTGGAWRTEYRVLYPPDHPLAGETRWMAFEGTVLCSSQGIPVTMLGIARDITQHKRAETLLSESKARLADALAAGQVMAFEWDAVTGQSLRSENASHILGFEQDADISPRNQFLSHVHSDDRASVKKRIRELNPSNPSYALHFRYVGAGGREVWLEETAKGEFDAKGKLLRIKGLTRDITERKRAEEKLRRNEREFRELLGALPAAIYVTDAAGRITYCNQAAVHLWGSTPKFGEDKWSDFSRFYHTDGTPMSLEECPTEIALKQGRAVKNAEALLERPDGTRIPIIPYPTPLHDETGAIVGVVNMTVDISDLKKAERALAERNVQLALAGRVARVGSYAYDVGADTIQVTEGYAALHGLPEGTTETTRSGWRARAFPDDLVRFQEIQSHAFSEQRGEYSIEYRLAGPDGNVRWIEARSFVSYSRNGRPQRVIGITIDVTERKRAEDHQRMLVAELDHRVKNVLATVSAVAAHTMEASGSMDHFVAALDGRIRSMASTHELLSGRRWEGVPLAELVRRELAPYASKHNTDLEGPEVLLSAEAGQTVALVLHELATNAAKHGALSRREGRVSVGWHQASNGHAPGRLAMEWRETGGPPVQTPRKSGYGTRVITELVPYELGGIADLAYPLEGVRCRLDIPAKWLCPGHSIDADRRRWESEG
jgi:PAS domain S-box-containing protein